MSYDASQFKRAALVKGWKQKTLAEKAGLSQPTVCEFLNGRNRSPETAKKLARALGLKLEDVVVMERAS